MLNLVDSIPKEPWAKRSRSGVIDYIVFCNVDVEKAHFYIERPHINGLYATRVFQKAHLNEQWSPDMRHWVLIAIEGNDGQKACPHSQLMACMELCAALAIKLGRRLSITTLDRLDAAVSNNPGRFFHSTLVHCNKIMHGLEFIK